MWTTRAGRPSTNFKLAGKMAEKLWQYLDAVSSKRDASILDDSDFEKEYQPFMINRALSYHGDAILAANLMNERASLDKRLQVLFLLNTLRPRKRFSRWVKSSVSDDARVIAEYYACGVRQARDLVGLHSSDQLAIMRARIDKGGTSTKKVPRHGTP
jgi:hypothetical protein